MTKPLQHRLMVAISKGAVIQATVAAAHFTERAFAIISGATANLK